LVVGEGLEEHDLSYFLMRAMREYYGCVRSPKTALRFKILSDRLNALWLRGVAMSRDEQPRTSRWDLCHYLAPYLRKALSPDEDDGDAASKVDLFLECCREMGYIVPHFKYGFVEMRTNGVDSEFLLARLFGVRTGICGFDELFGGGGPILADHFVSRQARNSSEEEISGRTILIRGRFGTGKTLLALELAVDVARKGGIAWLLPFEQPAIEHLYTINAMGLGGRGFSVDVATDVVGAVGLLNSGAKSEGADEGGALLILGAPRDSLDDFLAGVIENARRMKNYPLRILSIDPVNSLAVGSMDQNVVRSKFVEMIDVVKQEGVNVILVAEEGRPGDDFSFFEENIADTVIHLTVESRFEYAQRLIEIKKSRLQREQRGKHPFSIVPGAGIRVYPSSAAVRARIKDRQLRRPGISVRYGLKSLDDILGAGGIEAGDVIVIKGPSRSFKTPLGLPFLLGTDLPENRGDAGKSVSLSLFITVSDQESSVEHQARRYAEEIGLLDEAAKSVADIEICSIPSGYINPGYIFQRIEEKFLESGRRGARIDRVLIDDVARWEMSSPFVRAEETFGETLVEFLRKKGVTAVYICHELEDAAVSSLQASLIENADCLIELEKVEFRGQYRVMLRVVKARGLLHRRDSFELCLDRGGLRVKSTSSLLRPESGGDAWSVGATFFLSAASELQVKYNASVFKNIQAILLPKAVNSLASADLMVGSIMLSEFSAVDELQIFQFDDALLGLFSHASSEGRGLHEFSMSHFDVLRWSDVNSSMRHRVSTANGFWAVPYYADVGLLAVRKGDVDARSLGSWELLADTCEEWEVARPKDVFFDFCRRSADDLNCLFFEILSSYMPLVSGVAGCSLHSWLVEPEALLASKLFRRLCRRAYLQGELAVTSKSEELAVMQSVVRRDWYSGMNALLADALREEREGISVQALPGSGGLVVDWYLGIPSYSAAPDVGLEVIKLMTGRDAELERVRCGVGLPVRDGFYGVEADQLSVRHSISPYFLINEQELAGLLSRGVRRSVIGCYFEIRGLLAQHLRSVIEVESGTEEEVDAAMRAIFRSLRQKASFLLPNWQCKHCAMPGRLSSPQARIVSDD
jgi:KaiC/GvpD/RAD55 family RecA-like ATPase